MLAHFSLKNSSHILNGQITPLFFNNIIFTVKVLIGFNYLGFYYKNIKCFLEKIIFDSYSLKVPNCPTI